MSTVPARPTPDVVRRSCARTNDALAKCLYLSDELNRPEFLNIKIYWVVRQVLHKYTYFYAAAAARGAQITAVANPITVLESSRLVASADIRLLDDLRHKRIWTVKTSNFHHNLLGTLQSVGININDVEIKFATPADIKRAWNWGTVDAA